MRILAVAPILAIQVLTTPCPAQTITLETKGKLSSVLDTLQRTGCCHFTFKNEDIPAIRVVVRLKNVPVRKAVDSIFRNLPVNIRFDTLIRGVYWFYIPSDASPSMATNLAPVVVESYTNGLQQLKTANATGSIYVLHRPDVQRVISADPLDQLPGQIPGLMKDANVNNSLNFSIHGRNSLHAINGPYLLLDGIVNFANPQDFNPNDIESYSVMKDASSAGIWGTFGANGVIAATSFNGVQPDSFRFTLTQNITYQGRPNLRYIPRISIPSYISMEQQLFTQHYYDDILATYQSVSPVVALLYQQQNGQLSPGSAFTMISNLSRYDLRDETLHYLYRNSLNEQFHLSAAGGGKEDRYYLSLGYDVVPTPLVRNNYQRVTIHLANTYQMIPHRLEVATTLHLAGTDITDNNAGDIPVAWPYGPLADSKGNPLPINYRYSPFYIDTAGAGQLLNWQYKPLQELKLADNKLHRNSGYLDARVTYTISRKLSASVEYRQFLSRSEQRNLYDANSFNTRDMVNRYSTPGPKGIVYGIPPGDMLFIADTTEQSHHLRLKVTYSTLANRPHQLMVFGGADLNDLSITAHSNWQFGYDPRTGQSQPVNFAATFTDYVTGNSEMIPGEGEPEGMYYRYLSVYGNVMYSYRDKLSFYGSLRKDATNIVGAAANRQWAPFWALGVAWKLGWLKLRTSYGCSGNIGNRTAYLQTQSLGRNLYGAPESGISIAPDPGLTWETTYIWNTGADYGFLKDPLSPGGRLRGSLDVWLQRSANLLGYDTLAPSAGVPVFFGNSAATRGHGLDWVMKIDNLRGELRWTSTLMLSWATDRVTRYGMQPADNADYIAERYPKVGKASTALFAHDWTGLNPATGDPIINDGMRAYSSYLPQVFGSLIHTFEYKRWKLSALFTFKAAYWIRRPSIDYTQMLIGAYPGTKDYGSRWQVPGDEKRTSVPSFPSPADWNNASRDEFYQNSAVLVAKGDHLRWQDVRLDYIVKRRAGGLYQLDVYAYLSGLGIVWRSNRYGIDPDAPVYGEIPAPRTYSMGMRMNF